MSSHTSKYRNRMHLQNYTETRNEVKQKVKTWSDEAAFWGDIEFAYKGEEALGGNRESEIPKVVSVSQTWVYLRYRTDVQFLTRKRIRFGTRYFQIVASYDSGGDQREWKILCLEVQP